jgi:uncharacterized protein YndB with AHSA1/START domain
MPNATDFVVNKEKLQVQITRVFNASRDRLWKVVNDPKLVPEWWGPAQYKTTVDKMDVRVGGAWRYIHSGPDGEYAFNGVYKEIDPPTKVVMTFEFEPMPGHVNVQTMVLEELPDNKTKMHVTVDFDNLDDLEGMVGSGMEGGQTESYDRLDLLLERA